MFLRGLRPRTPSACGSLALARPPFAPCSRSWITFVGIRRQEFELHVAETHERRCDPAAHGPEVVVEHGTVLQRVLVELVTSLVTHLDRVLDLVEIVPVDG